MSHLYGRCGVGVHPSVLNSHYKQPHLIGDMEQRSTVDGWQEPPVVSSDGIFGIPLWSQLSNQALAVLGRSGSSVFGHCFLVIVNCVVH